MAQLEDLKAHEKYNLLLCMVSGAYKGTIPGNEDFKEWCDECTLTGFRPRMGEVAQYEHFELMRKADYVIGIVNEDSTTRGAEVQRSVCAQKGIQEYEELVNKNAYCLTNYLQLQNSMKLIERKNEGLWVFTHKPMKGF